MASTGLFIAQADLETWPASLRAQVIELVFGRPQTAQIDEPVLNTDEPEYLAQLTPTQARNLLDGCTRKTKRALEIIAKGDTRFFHIKDVAEALNCLANELKSVWAGLTRRTRTVTGNPSVHLTDIAGDLELENDILVDRRLAVSQKTYLSLRIALSIS
jgi:hypothetical protein